MTNVTPLSPAAQAVLDASHFPQKWEHAIAAALRAAAYETDWESGDPKLLLEGIAAELKDNANHND